MELCHIRSKQVEMVYKDTGKIRKNALLFLILLIYKNNVMQYRWLFMVRILKEQFIIYNEG